MIKSHAAQIFRNALLLATASLLMRTVGVSFQVYVSNRAGAEAMGLYSLLSGVYGFALTLATSGIHLGVTRLTVEAVGKDRPAHVPAVLRRATVYALFFGCLASILLFSTADVIGNHWLHDTRTIPSLRLLSITLPLISLSSAWGGYFTAVRRPYKNAAVQVCEQALKIGGTMYFLSALPLGDVEQTCCALVLGGVGAEVASFLLEFLLFRSDRKRHFPTDVRGKGGAVGKKLLGITLPIALTTYIRSGLVTLQHILIPAGLRSSGTSHAAALVAYGSIHSMAMPVILYPAALISAFSGLLVPELAEAEAKDSRRHITYMISRVWSLALLFSIGVAGILICFSAEIGEALYPATDAGKYIRILAPLVPIMYVDTATDAMMKGLGEQVYSMKINIADAAISVLLIWLLIPRYGIDGYIFAIYFSEVFNTVFSITHLLSISKTPVRLFKWVYKPLLCIVGATCAVRALLMLTGWRIVNSALSIVLHCLIAVLIYLILLLLSGALDREDVCWFRGLFRKGQ
ncbi:MAG: polysaccharide biosynthesis C-terminal domain-containing protein [Clostridia bacterium]|nr:polysaccharide biosynthesis C-terminal domain-containing protein [Clostridia bacterium]